MKINRSNFNDISRINKKIILFGSGNINKKTIAKLNNDSIEFIVDNSKNLQGTLFYDYDIKSPNEIKPGYLILICSTAITPITNQLIKMGFLPEKDFMVSPILNDLLAIQELEQIQTEFYFTSGSVPEQNFGGGLYKTVINGEEVHTSKIYTGPCYGTIIRKDKLYFIDTDIGILNYDPKDKSTSIVLEIPKGSRAHGISYNEDNGNFYVACSEADSIIEYDSSFNEVKQFKLSNKIGYYKDSMHHCNDNVAIGNSLFVSMFSSTGNWKNGVFDGCIAEFNIETGERSNDITNGLYMPHNICQINGSLHVLDSLPGHLRADNFDIIGTFSAFTRGLDFNKGLFYIGQSKNRNFSKVLGISNNISIDCGVIIFHPEIKVSRFIQLSMKIGEIHSISHF